MSDAYTSTTNYDGPELTLESLTQIVEQLKPDLYYRTSEFVPKVDADGNPFCISMPDPLFGFDERPMVLRDVQIAYIHPDNLPAFLRMAKQNGLKVVPKDNG